MYKLFSEYKKMFVAVLIVAVTTFVYAKVNEVQEGAWPDGTLVAYQCSEGAKGQVRFVIKSPDGTTRNGEFRCGETI